MSAATEQKLVFFGCLVAAIILHELSHGVVALWFGDDTAKRAGRLTLNPLPHIDLFGSILLPAMLVLAGAPVFGWAKPVPVNPQRMRRPRRDMLVVGLAGPGTNFALMALAAVGARALFRRLTLPPSGVLPWTFLPLDVQVLIGFAYVNLLLGVFNLLPIPPLDGSSLIERVLPRDWLPGWYRFRPYGMLLLLVLVFWGGLLDRVFTPFSSFLHALHPRPLRGLIGDRRRPRPDRAMRSAGSMRSHESCAASGLASAIGMEIANTTTGTDDARTIARYSPSVTSRR